MSSTNAENDRRIDYIELPVTSVTDAKRFYGEVFGWTFEDFGPSYASFSDGRTNGGFREEAEIRHGGPLLVLYATDLEVVLARVEAAGCAIVRPIYDFPGGRRFHFTDPAGNELAVWSEPEDDAA